MSEDFVDMAVLINCVLTGARFAEARLTLIDLTLSQLERADFHGCDMRAAVLKQAFLGSADLAEAQLGAVVLGNHDGRRRNSVLDQSRLWGASLCRASLVGASLAETDFQGADLTGADLSETRLAGTNFDSATLEDTKFDGTDLREVRGLRIRRVRVEERDIEFFVVLVNEDTSGTPWQADRTIAAFEKLLHAPVVLCGDVSGKYFGRKDLAGFLTKTFHPSRIHWSPQDTSLPLRV